MRISVTTLESFRLFMRQDWMEEEALLADIRGEFRPTREMLVGLAFGRCIERPDRWRRNDGDGFEVFVKNEHDRWEGFSFSNADMAPVLSLFNRAGVFEVKGTMYYGDAEIVTKADEILGTTIVENKTKTTTPQFDNYFDSYQWRFMLDIFKGTRCHYNVFELRNNPRGDESLVKDVHQFNVYPYQGMHADCVELVGEFLDYIKQRELERYFVRSYD